jgi:tRNA pseudouridine13 synthase
MLTRDLPGTGGALRTTPEDFVVDEVPAYLPAGEGDHLMVRVQKRLMTTDDVARALASRAGCRPQEVGYAGRKDRDAVTTQWFSVPATADPAALASLDLDGVRVLESGRHHNKLRTGHLHGNRFAVTLRAVCDDAEARARAILERIAAEGLPNGFGPQRFGRDGRNVEQAREWIVGGRRPPRDKSRRMFLVSSLQAALFNRVVERRLADGGIRALDGDICKRHDSGGMFVAGAADEVAPRIAAREVSPTGPIYGARMWWPEGAAKALEEEILRDAGLDPDVLERFKKDGKGSRRPLRVFPEDVAWRTDGDALVLEFTLDAGSFATTLLAEVTKDPTLAPPIY